MKTLYIIHGWTYSTKPWEKTISLLKSSGIEVKMLHVPGLTTPSEDVFTIEDYKNWANSSIPNDAIALGHSNGGRILLNLCLERPQKLRHLILLDSAGIYEKSKKRDFFRFLSRLGAPLKKSKFLRKAFHKLIGASDYDHAPANMQKTLENMLNSDKSLNVSKITTPTSILWGENDTITPLRQGKTLHKNIKNSTFHSFPNWTHAPYISDPESLAKAILEVMEKI